MFNVPDYIPVSTSSSLSCIFLYKQQSQLHRYQLFHLVPYIQQSICSMKEFPPSFFPSLVSIRFGGHCLSGRSSHSHQSIPIHPGRNHLPLLHCIRAQWRNGRDCGLVLTSYYGYSLHFWKEASPAEKQLCIEGIRKVVEAAHLGDSRPISSFIADSIHQPFITSINNYAHNSCHLYYQNALSILSAFPYSNSMKRLLLFSSLH